MHHAAYRRESVCGEFDMPCCTGRQKEQKRRQELAQKTTQLLDGLIVFVCSTCDGTACGGEGIKRRGTRVASLAAGCYGLLTTTATNIQADARVSFAAIKNSINRSLGLRTLRRGAGRKLVLFVLVAFYTKV